MNLDELYDLEISKPHKIDRTTLLRVRPWVIKAAAEEETRPSIQLWEDEPGREHRRTQRLQTVRLLLRYKEADPLYEEIAYRLLMCRRDHRCCSGACPECGRLLQRWFVRKSKRFISDYIDKGDRDLVAITVIPVEALIPPGQLQSFSIENLQRRLKAALDKIGLDSAIGAVDISLNEDRDEKHPPHWCVHIYIVTSTDQEDHVKRKLRKIYKRHEQIPVPVKITSFQNCAWRRSYAFKIEFLRRVSYDATKIRNGITRTCRDTCEDELRVNERLELIKYLD